MAETVLIRIYRKDAEILNQYMGLLTIVKKRRMTIAETLHEILERHVVSVIKKAEKEQNAI